MRSFSGTLKRGSTGRIVIGIGGTPTLCASLRSSFSSSPQVTTKADRPLTPRSAHSAASARWPKPSLILTYSPSGPTTGPRKLVLPTLATSAGMFGWRFLSKLADLELTSLSSCAARCMSNLAAANASACCPLAASSLSVSSLSWSTLTLAAPPSFLERAICSSQLRRFAARSAASACCRSCSVVSRCESVSLATSSARSASERSAEAVSALRAACFIAFCGSLAAAIASWVSFVSRSCSVNSSPSSRSAAFFCSSSFASSASSVSLFSCTWPTPASAVDASSSSCACSRSLAATWAHATIGSICSFISSSSLSCTAPSYSSLAARAYSSNSGILCCAFSVFSSIAWMLTWELIRSCFCVPRLAAPKKNR
mmetsp:Transcript_2660/g.5798  ORF Transcript_2660/g.5798 Transcript_2660/m.5798 type:complete len:370 (+) Transcript_2660:1652-2761(+)